jgi:hypothetical protein
MSSSVGGGGAAVVVTVVVDVAVGEGTSIVDDSNTAVDTDGDANGANDDGSVTD